MHERFTRFMNGISASVESIGNIPPAEAGELFRQHERGAAGGVTQTKQPPEIPGQFMDHEALLAFYDFPAEHWKHIRTGNLIESTFATVATARSAPKAASRTTPA
jgi:hypothetical protein